MIDNNSKNNRNEPISANTNGEVDRPGKSMTAKQRAWDMIFPMLFTFLCLLCVQLVMMVIYNIAYGAGVGGLVDADQYYTLPGFLLITDIVFYAICIFVMRRHYKRDRVRFGVNKNAWSPVKIIIAAAAAVGLSVLMEYIIAVSGLAQAFPEYSEAVSGGVYGQNPVLMILALVVFAPVAEELIFRGVFYDRVKDCFGRGWALVISALAFGIYHGNMVQFVYGAVIGLLLAWYYEKSRSVVVPIIAHMSINATALAMGIAAARL